MAEMKDYAKCAEKKKTIEFRIDQADKRNLEFAFYDGLIRIVLPMTDFFDKPEEDVRELMDSTRTNWEMGKKFEVQVVSADAEKNVVYCSVQELKKSAITKRKAEIDEVLANKGIEKVKAKVISIYGKKEQSFANLITDDGIRLLLLCKEYDWDYTDDLHDVLKLGHYVEVGIYKHNDSKKPGDYIVSRAKIQPNPWIGLNERFHKGDLVRCRIVQKWKVGFGGRVDGLNGILAFVGLPHGEAKKVRIVVGEYYLCSVGGVNEETHSFRLYPFAYCNDKD